MPSKGRSGSVTLTIESLDAEALLRSLPERATGLVFSAVRDWTASERRVRSARLTTLREPEDGAWAELVVEMQVDATTEEALHLWDTLARRVDDAKRRLEPEERAALDAGLAFHLHWASREE
ncbi:MAG TPA: hypothetical protein VNM43_11445 [Dehalococcoidia bacterium]|nr:hypothetical protein [Dehalococcoidia bacterium]